VADDEWKKAQPWNPPTLLTLAPDGSKTYGVKFRKGPRTTIAFLVDTQYFEGLARAYEGAEVLVVPQFTLYADSRHGRRPSFTEAARPEVADPLIEHFVRELKVEGISCVATGVFRASMLVEIHNDGPVTIALDTADL
jgi:D-tyrosyl-tRNA(Tyr) deacylase